MLCEKPHGASVAVGGLRPAHSMTHKIERPPGPKRYNLVHISMSGSPLLAVPIVTTIQEDP